jgi:hypothetical protein
MPHQACTRAAGTPAMLHMATLVLTERDVSTVPSTSHVAAATCLVHACILSSAADVDHSISGAAPAASRQDDSIGDIQKQTAEERRKLPVLRLLIDTSVWMAQCAARLSARASSGEVAAGVLYGTSVRHSEVCSRPCTS